VSSLEADAAPPREMTVGTSPVSGSTEITLCGERGDLELGQRVPRSSRRDLSAGRALRPSASDSAQRVRAKRARDDSIATWTPACERESGCSRSTIYFSRGSLRPGGEHVGLTLIHFGRFASFSVGYVRRRLAQRGVARATNAAALARRCKVDEMVVSVRPGELDGMWRRRSPSPSRRSDVATEGGPGS